MLSLGINYSQRHDSAACLVRDGHVVVAIAEERLSRVKHDTGFPLRAIQACLDFGGIRASNLDFIAYGWQPPGDTYRHDIACFIRGRLPASYLNLSNCTRHFLSMWHQGNGQRRFEQHFGKTSARVLFVEHHLAHAISAYALSGFDDAAILVVDGRGAWEATTIWKGKQGRLEPVETIDWPNSLGLFYAAFTGHLGFQPYSDEWKVMGLAPYGKPGINLCEFIEYGEDGYRVNFRALLGDGRSGPPALDAKFGPSRPPDSELTDKHRDIAFAVQDAAEKVLLGSSKRAVEKVGVRNLCLAGGVALNSKANGRILLSGVCDRFFVQPASGDDGVAIGAALAPMLDGNCPLPMMTMRKADLGNEFADSEIEATLRNFNLHFVQTGEPSERAAEMIAMGKIIGWFQGRMEFGPHALGHRSILADPRDPKMKDRINSVVKVHESWRPFGPSLLAEAAQEYLESAYDSPFMALTAQIRAEKHAVIPSVTHVDGTARPQTVENTTSPRYWQLIKRFGERTGVPVIMNTSFNLRGEPIVCTPVDAVRTFFSSGLDALFIGDFLIEK